MKRPGGETSGGETSGGETVGGVNHPGGESSIGVKKKFYIGVNHKRGETSGIRYIYPMLGAVPLGQSSYTLVFLCHQLLLKLIFCQSVTS